MHSKLKVGSKDSGFSIEAIPPDFCGPERCKESVHFNQNQCCCSPFRRISLSTTSVKTVKPTIVCIRADIRNSRSRENRGRNDSCCDSYEYSWKSAPHQILQESRKAAEKQQEIIRAVFSVLSSRGEKFCNFVESEDIFGPDTKLVYKHFATLYFVFAIDNAENELGILDLIQLFVEILDKSFKNVCELDIVYNFNKAFSQFLSLDT